MASNRFVGTWRLVFARTTLASGEVTNEFGDQPSGYLIYTEDGYMAVAIMEDGRGHFASSRFGLGSVDEKVAAFDTYLSYSGTYEVKGDKMIHHVDVSLFPNWSGGDQERGFEFAEDRLTLTTGLAEKTSLTWRRA